MHCSLCDNNTDNEGERIIDNMPSLQNSAGAGKAAKFVSADPLGPMANPFDGLVGIKSTCFA
jgi:hypothetical protein